MDGLNWNQLLIGVLSGSVLSGLGSWLFYNQRLARERKSGGKKMIADEMLKALEIVRDYERKIRTIENVWPDMDATKDPFDALAYPAFMFDQSAFYSYLNELGHVLDIAEPYLDRKTVAYLYAFQRYLLSLAQAERIGEGTPEVIVRQAGVTHKTEIDRWQKHIDAHVVKCINRHPWKLQSLSGLRWGLLRSRIIKKYQLQ
ncbi:hypothetical protein [Lacticaseibacillus suibinensis]|uniref:hypothetical protein n=1 Tax=Lacticaseibacillus suibinensis TaxID=2486011 RepID=UPI001941C685|nr:hypothetical protein [Lacticaseibacillus suibinensis]